MPRVMVFDIGRVLIDFQPEAFYDRVIGEAARKALFAQVDLYGMNLAIDAGEGFEAPVRACAERHPEWSAEIMLWHQRWPELLNGAIEGSVALMRKLKAQGTPVLALTNFGNETLSIARGLFDFLNEFDHMTVSAELRLLKPDPAIYAALERATGYAPQDLFFTDDVPENVAAAAARGWTTHHFTSPSRLADALHAAELLQKD